MVKSPKNRTGFAMAELMVAMAILTIAMMPLALSFANEQRLARNSYQRAVALEIIDGEMEILMAGEWRAFQPGTQPYPLRAESAKNMPPGKAILTLSGNHIRLQWLPEKKHSIGEIIREADAP
jgi:prepilin-type N-terminal cleavage/methylation domain-containing protein